MKITASNSERGLNPIDVIVLVAGVMFVLVVGFLLLEGYAMSHHRAQSPNCINNLRQIELAFKSWSMDNNDRFPMELSVTNGGTRESAVQGVAFTTFEAMSNELSQTKLLVCPLDQQRKTAGSFADLRNENVSYFIDVDFSGKYPRALLVGDRKLTMDGIEVMPGLASFTTNNVMGWKKDIHIGPNVGLGSVGMGDGSTLTLSAAKLQSMVRDTGFATNRLAVP